MVLLFTVLLNCDLDIIGAELDNVCSYFNSNNASCGFFFFLNFFAENYVI